MTIRPIAMPALALLVLAAGCRHSGDIDVTRGVGITAVRSSCPQVSIPAGTGDITLFDPATSQVSTALDVSATMTNVRSTCNDAGAEIATAVTFTVEATRARATEARDLSLPFYISVLQGGSAVVAKRVGHIALHFEAGSARATANGQASTSVNRAAATLPSDVRDRLTERRRPGQEDAAIDPLTIPEVRQAVLRTTFEALVGFQLTPDQLRYNATR